MRSNSPRALATRLLRFGSISALAFAFVFSDVGAGVTPAWAQDPEEEVPAEDSGDKHYMFELGLFGGYHFFADEHGLRQFDDDPIGLSPKNGGVFGLRLTLNFNPWIAVEADGWWSPTKTRDDQTGLSVFGARGAFHVNFVGSGPFRPFLQVGAGAIISISNDTNLIPGDQDPSLHAGLGAKIYFGDRAGLRLDGIIMAPPAFMAETFEVGSETSFGGPDFQVLATLFFNFTELEKSTKQVIVKKETVVVQQPPPPPPPPAPPADPDGDGIAGDADKCPNVAEDRDGFEDEDGCPENDNDQDGIPDAQDKCPMKPENKNGVDDDDGCPEEDTDGDGFIGSRDKCPDAPETVNNFQDDDGCPDEIPQAIKKFTGVIEGINFKTGKADILPGSYAILDRAVAVLKEYPEIKLEIQGHTDNRGKADYNRDLSQRRADAVKQYFVAKGIAPERLNSVGYGMDRPIADNDSEFGRSKNRRTEFRLIGSAN